MVVLNCNSTCDPFTSFVKFVIRNVAIRQRYEDIFVVCTRNMHATNAAKCWVHLAAIVLIKRRMASISSSRVLTARKGFALNHYWIHTS